MRIIEQDEQHIVIGPTGVEYVYWIIVLAFLVVFIGSFLIIFFPPFLIILAVIIFFILGRLINNRIVLNKPTKDIVFSSRPFLLFNRRNVIQFSDVDSVRIDYAAEAGFWIKESNTWKLALNSNGKLIGIDKSGQEESVINLGKKISNFIGKQLEFMNQKPDFYTTRDYVDEDEIDRLRRDLNLRI